MPAASGPGDFSGLDGFTNAETRSFFQWITHDLSRETPGLVGVPELMQKAASAEDLGNRLLDWFMCFLHEQPGSNIFYTTVVEKAIVSVHWNEIGERLFSPETGNPGSAPVRQRAETGSLSPGEQAFLDWILVEKRDTLAGLVSGGADAVEIMEMLEGVLARIRAENGFLSMLLESARKEIRLSLVTARIFDFFK